MHVPLPPDPMTDDGRATLVRELIGFWMAHPQRRNISPEQIRQMAQEAAAFARGLMGDIEELRQMSRLVPPSPARGEGA